MYPASIIAYAFVKKGIDEKRPVTQMKLQKLLYFAHGLHLAAYKKELIEEPIYAWKFGPVVSEIYHQYKLYGSNPISDFNCVLGASYSDNMLSVLNNEATTVINETWELLKGYDAIKLSNWTHLKGSPWERYFKPGINDVEIPKEAMEEYFKQYLVS